MRIKINDIKFKVKTLIIILIYKILLEYSYVKYVHIVHGYEGFALEIDIFKMVESYFAAIIIILLLPISEKKVSSIALKVLNIIMIIPIFSLYYLKSQSREYFYAVLVSFLITILITKLQLFRIKNQKINFNLIVNIVMTMNTLVVYVGMIYFNGPPKLQLLDLSQVYNVRGTIDYGYSFMNYLVSWQGVIINPYLMISYLQKKNKNKFTIITLLQLILYLITGNRAFFLYSFLIIALVYFLRKRSFIISFTKGMIAFLIISLITFFSGVNKWIASLMLYRTLFLPAQISFQYHDFFSVNGFVKLSHSIFEMFFREPIYNNNPVLIIGETYYKNNHPNTGYLGDAFMNFGFIGMIVFSLVFGVVLMLIDSLSNTEYKKVVSKAFIIILMISLTNVGLLTTLFNGGMALYILILWGSYDNKIYEPGGKG